MSRNQNTFVAVVASILFSLCASTQAQICDVAPDGSACVQTACSAIPEDQCLPAALRVDWSTGAIVVAECQCRDMNACHIEFGNASPFAVGYCPTGEACRVVEVDTNNDGLPDVFRAECRPEGVSVCCLDVDDGPVPFDTCINLGEDACAAEGGLHQFARNDCSARQACCMGFNDGRFCAELHPVCCLASGGVPLGPDSACTDLAGETTCGPACGGFAGIPCEDDTQFCMFPEGACCCDFMGMCRPRPDACPAVRDPVCGCDQQTYGNECEAFLADVTIDHRGPCGQSACCLPSGECAVLSPDVCVEEGGDPVLNVGCEVVDCAPPALGACCFDPAPGVPSCVMATEAECADRGGAYQGDGSDCPSDASVDCGDRCDGLCTDAASCFVGCGKLVQGAECVLFQAESGELMLLDNLGEFTVGDYVAVKGCRATDCATTCLQGAGCLRQNTIRACATTCGGIAGIPCENPGQFCRFPEGTCGQGDMLGACVPIPDGCPDVWEPVCGCDGITYSNECDASAAGVSLSHPGECLRVCGGLGPAPPCEPNEFCRQPTGTCGDPTGLGVCVMRPDACPEIYDPVCGCNGTTYSNACQAAAAGVNIAQPGECTECRAVRAFSDPPFTFCSTEAKKVRIVLNAPASATAIAVDEQPPAGWEVFDISQGGEFDSINGKIKWGPFFPPFPPELTYAVVPQATSTVDNCFRGVISVDGFNHVICGGDCLEPACCPPLAADAPQPACDQCPVGGCDTCDDGCANGRVSMCELVGFACAWKHGCNDDLAGMTRAAFIWRNGECYCWDDADNVWQPADCDGPADGCCAGDPGGGSARGATGDSTADDSNAGATARFRRTVGDRFSRARETMVEVVVNPPAGTLASGVELDLPDGWSAVTISDGGEWDDVYHKVKWGPFFGDGQTTVSVKVRRVIAGVSRKARAGGRTPPTLTAGTAAAAALTGFGGTVSFDGFMRAVDFD